MVEPFKVMGLHKSNVGKREAHVLTCIVCQVVCEEALLVLDGDGVEHAGHVDCFADDHESFTVRERISRWRVDRIRISQTPTVAEVLKMVNDPAIRAILDNEPSPVYRRAQMGETAADYAVGRMRSETPAGLRSANLLIRELCASVLTDS